MLGFAVLDLAGQHLDLLLLVDFSDFLEAARLVGFDVLFLLAAVTAEDFLLAELFADLSLLGLDVFGFLPPRHFPIQLLPLPAPLETEACFRFRDARLHCPELDESESLE